MISIRSRHPRCPRDGRVLIWDPDIPGTAPAELGRHHGWVLAVAVLADGQVITSGADGRALVWDPARAGTQILQLTCPVTALATTAFATARPILVIAHDGSGFSLWSFIG